MIQIPALCDSCGSVFPSGIAASYSTITIVGTTTGPCPKCNGMGHVPDGTYQVTDNIIQILSAPQRSIDELMQLAEIIKKSQNQDLPIDEMKKEAERRVPALSRVFDLLPKNREEARADIKFFLTTILTVISILSATQSGPMIEVEQVFKEIYINEKHYYPVEGKDDGLSANTPIVNARKIGRNDPCHCGSGVKFKKCHGKM